MPVSPQRHCLKKLNVSDLLEPEVMISAQAFSLLRYMFGHHYSVYLIENKTGRG